MSDAFPHPFNDPLQGIVAAGGALTIKFGPQYNNTWYVTQISIEMPTAPAGSLLVIRRMGSLIAPAPSAKRATASGDPPIFLNGGEFMTVEWTGCTPGDVGKVLVTYNKGLY